MWTSCSCTWLVTVALVRHYMHLDFFRIFFFFSPFWVTSLWAPLQKDRSGYRLVSYTLICFLIYWITLQSFPVQCRHAWGIRMVSDKPYWGDTSGVIRQAIDSEKNNFYIDEAVENMSRTIFWPSRNINRSSILRSQEVLNATTTDLVQAQLVTIDQDHSRAKKWIAPLTGGKRSLDFLLLRAYCNLHREDEDIPHVFPLRTLGILPDQVNITVPCPYWSCIMTEARPDGKLPFFAIIGAFTVLNYAHYRCDCLPNRGCQHWFGAGQCRLWWAWFWATFLPLWSVMLIKTTFDMELTQFVEYVFDLMDAKFISVTESETGKILVGLSFVGIAGCLYYYRDYVYHHFGLDEGWFLPNFLAPPSHPEDHNTFQVCVWRVDTCSTDEIARVNPQDDGSSEDDGGGSRRSLMVCGRKRKNGSSPWPFSGIKDFFPMFKRGNHRDHLKTVDGSIPALRVCFFYGSEEVQATRIVKPTSAEWFRGDPVYFQETFRMNIDWRPRQKLRVEIKDANGQFGQAKLGHVSFDEASIVNEFNMSLQVQDDSPWHPVPVMQVVRMLEPPGSTRSEEVTRVRELRNLGFTPHHLSDGGSLWLAFTEIEDKGLNAMPFLC